MPEPWVPPLGAIYTDYDPNSTYRVKVIAVDLTLTRLKGKRCIQLQNLATGRRHWTSLRGLGRYRRIT